MPLSIARLGLPTTNPNNPNVNTTGLGSVFGRGTVLPSYNPLPPVQSPPPPGPGNHDVLAPMDYPPPPAVANTAGTATTNAGGGGGFATAPPPPAVANTAGTATTNAGGGGGLLYLPPTTTTPGISTALLTMSGSQMWGAEFNANLSALGASAGDRAAVENQRIDTHGLPRLNNDIDSLFATDNTGDILSAPWVLRDPSAIVRFTDSARAGTTIDQWVAQQWYNNVVDHGVKAAAAAADKAAADKAAAAKVKTPLPGASTPKPLPVVVNPAASSMNTMLLVVGGALGVYLISKMV